MTMSDSAPAIRLFATDVDDTILGEAKATERFRDAWESLDAKRRPRLVYNTGRSAADVQWLVLDRRIPAPEFIIGGLGTELHDPVDGRVATDYQLNRAPGTASAAVNQIVELVSGVHPQPREFQNPWKSSWHWHRASAAEVAHLRRELERSALDVSVNYTGNVFLDLIPRCAGKGNALAWLCRRLGLPLDQVLVAGAGANNASMFAMPGVRGLIVGNASFELFTAAGPFKPMVVAEPAAAGVLAGLRQFGILDAAGARVPVAAAGANSPA